MVVDQGNLYPLTTPWSRKNGWVDMEDLCQLATRIILCQFATKIYTQ